MTEHEYRLSKANLKADLETAERMGCKRVIADCKLRLQKLEDQRENELHPRYTGPSFQQIVSDQSLKPTYTFLVMFANGERLSMDIYSKFTDGMTRQQIEKDFVDSLNLSREKTHAPRAVKAHMLPRQGGRKSAFEMACERISERFEQLELEKKYRKKYKEIS